MKQNTIVWNADQTPSELKPSLQELASFYPIVEAPAENAINVEFEKSDKTGGMEVQLSGNQAKVTYDMPHYALRGVGTLLAGLVEEAQPYTETSPFESVGVMLDMSRNAVMTVKHIKCWLRQLALLGYNLVVFCYCHSNSTLITS